MRLILHAFYKNTTHLLLFAIFLLAPVKFNHNSNLFQFNHAFAEKSTVEEGNDPTEHTPDLIMDLNTVGDSGNTTQPIEADKKQTGNQNRPNDGFSELKSLKPVTREQESELLGNWGDK